MTQVPSNTFTSRRATLPDRRFERERRGGVSLPSSLAHSCARRPKVTCRVIPLVSLRAPQRGCASRRRRSSSTDFGGSRSCAMPPESAAGLWGEDDIHRREEEEAGEGFDFADFADDELTPAETCARIEALAVAHALGVLGRDDGDQARTTTASPLRWSSRSSDARAAPRRGRLQRSTLAFRARRRHRGSSSTRPRRPLPTSASGRCSARSTPTSASTAPSPSAGSTTSPPRQNLFLPAAVNRC